MKLTTEKTAELKALCNKFRIDVLTTLHAKQTGHPGGSLSVCEILTTLYFNEINSGDKVVLSKGHAAPMLYRVLAEKGFFPVEEMNTLRDINTRLQGHPCSLYTPGVELSSGPLGIGLSAALGMALGLKLNENSPSSRAASDIASPGTGRIYAILGDGEINEGTIWEACMSASKFKADNLCAILDYNKVQLDGTTADIMPMGNIRAKFESFGWHCIECGGHDIAALCAAYDKARLVKNVPVIIMAHTVKGKGVSFMENKNTWHGKPISNDDYAAAMSELGGANNG